MLIDMEKHIYIGVDGFGHIQKISFGIFFQYFGVLGIG